MKFFFPLFRKPSIRRLFFSRREEGPPDHRLLFRILFCRFLLRWVISFSTVCLLLHVLLWFETTQVYHKLTTLQLTRWCYSGKLIAFLMTIENSEGFRLCHKMTIVSYHLQYTVRSVMLHHVLGWNLDPIHLFRILSRCFKGFRRSLNCPITVSP